jgi:cation diffusion facilitator CzcD-associated flavoprotein CzcO
VIVAGGHEHRPFIPAWPGRAEFGGEVIHAAGYREPSGYVGRDVLVVGPGCTGAEVAFDLVQGGAARVRLAVRTPPNIIVRQAIGAPLAVFFNRFPAGVGDAVMRFVRRRTIGDLSDVGLPMPEEGVFSRLRRLGVAPMIVDPEVIEAIRERRIEIVAAVEAFDETGVSLADGSRVEPDAVIAATGYRPGLEPLVGHLGVLDAHGSPRVLDGEALPGLRFVGYDPRPAQLRHGGREAARAAKAIARAPKSELVVGVLRRPATSGGHGH